MNRTPPFGLLLRQWRNQAGLSLRELGIAVGRSTGNLSRIERGHLPPPQGPYDAAAGPGRHRHPRHELSRIERGLLVPPAADLDQLATTLGVPRAALYEAAGRRPPRGGRPVDAGDAVMADPVLTAQERQLWCTC